MQSYAQGHSFIETNIATFFFDCPASTDLWNSRVASYNEKRAHIDVNYHVKSMPQYPDELLSGRLEVVKIGSLEA